MAMRPLSLLLLAVLLPVTGCYRSGAPPQRQPRVQVPAVWNSGEATERTVDVHWWKQFGDPQLDAMIEEVLSNNHQLLAAADRLEAALNQARIAGADLVPSMGFALNSSRQRQNFIGLPLPGFAGRVPQATYTLMGVGLDISWEADLWGRIRSGQVRAGALASAQSADLAAARHSLAAQTAKAWFASAAAQLQLALAREMVASYKTTSQWVQKRFEAGFQTALEFRMALADLSEAESLVHLRREQLDRGILQIELLAGRYPGGDLKVRDTLPAVSSQVPAGLPSELLTRRPDLIAAQRRLLASDAGIVQSQAALHPRLSLTTGGGTATDSLLSLLNGNYAVWNLLGNLVQPIFQGGRLRRQVDIARSRSEEALEIYTDSVLKAFGEVETALSVERLLRDRLLELEESAAEARAARKQAQLRYRHGQGGVLTVLETERRILNMKSQILSLQHLLLDNRIDLHLALGGGFDSNAPAGSPGALIPVMFEGEQGK
ncbi:MAG: efflux transporter outer membrane subunit [Acidobacteriota bacterium]|nr:efflux transporter outer membrane subunit [Acidobacteriota bacterium]